MKEFPSHSALIATLLACLVTCVSTARAQSELSAALALEEALVKTIEQCEKSVVSIARVRTDRNDNPAVRVNPFAFPDRREQQRRNRTDPESPDFVPNDFGAGVVLARKDDPNGRYVLTNYHVVKGGPIYGQPAASFDSRLYVRFADGHGYFASIRAADPRSDLAVLDIDFTQMKLERQDLRPLRFAEKFDVRKGQIVIGLGNPLSIARDGSASASWGIVSNIGRVPKPPAEVESATVLPDETIHHTGTLLQVDMKLNLGTSGGALLNLKGEFVGLTTSLAAIDGYETSAGFAIPANEAFQRIFDTLARGQEVEYGFLGVGPQDVPSREVAQRGLPIPQASAPMLIQVFENSPAGRAGLRRGDLVLEIGGTRILDRRDLMRVVSLQTPDEQVPVKVWRPEAGRPLQLTVMLGKWPAQNDEAIIETSPRFPAFRGLEIDYPTGRYRFMTRTFAYPDAVLVRSVAENSPAAQAGLQSGEFIALVNGRAVRNPREFHTVVGELTGPIQLSLEDGREVTLSEAPPETPQDN